MSIADSDNESLSPEMKAWRDLAGSGANIGCSKNHAAEIRIFDMLEEDKMSCIGANLMLSQLFSREHFQAESLFRSDRGLTYAEYSFPEDCGISRNNPKYYTSQEYLDTLAVKCCFEKARMFLSVKAWDDALKALYRGTTYMSLPKRERVYFHVIRAECNLGLLRFEECSEDLKACAELLRELSPEDAGKADTEDRTEAKSQGPTNAAHDMEDKLLRWFASEHEYLRSRLQYATYKSHRNQKKVARKMMNKAI